MELDNGSNQDTDQQTLANADDRNSSNREPKLGLAFDGLNKIWGTYPKLVPSIQSTITKMPETISAFSGMGGNILGAYSTVLKISEKLSETVWPVYESLTRLVNSIDWERLSKLYEESNWENLQYSASRWGEFGWVISDLTLHEINDAPKTLPEANLRYMECMTNERMERLFERAMNGVARKKDFEECVVLYRGRHYKPCAMVLCSLIEGSLIKQIPKDIRRRNGFKTLKELGELDDSIADALWVQNTLSTYAYFFSSADNFNREKEGELNRNFLMHGMMYKPVRKRTCIKLFLLLESIVSSMPEVVLFQSQKR